MLQITIESTQTPPEQIVNGLRRLLPVNSEAVPNISINNKRETSSLASWCIIEECESSFSCEWTGALPTKCKF